VGSGGRTGKRDRTHRDSGARRRDRLLVMNVTFARLGKTGRNATLKIGDDLWRRVTVEGRVGWRQDEQDERGKRGVFTPSACIGVVYSGIDIAQVNLAHEAIDLERRRTWDWGEN